MHYESKLKGMWIGEGTKVRFSLGQYIYIYILEFSIYLSKEKGKKKSGLKRSNGAW